MNYGFSVYFGLDNTNEENINLLKEAHSLGFSRIFTSLHIPETNYDTLKKEVADFFQLAKEYDMDIICDISPNTFKFLELDNMNLSGLAYFGVKTIRIDFGYSEEEIALMSRNNLNIKIQLNASTITKDFFDKLDKFSPDYTKIDALHNFYPRVGTGISEEVLLEKNSLLKEKGILVSAFVQSNGRKRSPLKDGLPTLEFHRGMEIRQSSNHLFALGNNCVFVGDSLPSNKELSDLSSLDPHCIELRIEKKTTDEVCSFLLEQTYSSRTDAARDAVRASESRLMLSGKKISENNNNTDKTIGDVTIDNHSYGRYEGELQVLLCNQNFDTRTNLVAKVLQNDIHMLQYIKDGKKFCFKY